MSKKELKENANTFIKYAVLSSKMCSGRQKLILGYMAEDESTAVRASLKVAVVCFGTMPVSGL